MPYLFALIAFIPSFAWLLFFLKEVKDQLGNFGISQRDFLCVLLFAAAEEILKFALVYMVIRRSKYFDEPVDAMIYMIAGALGFALVENVAILLQTTILLQAVGVITMRFVGATLLHALCSGLVGYYWAKSVQRSPTPLMRIKNFKLVIFGLISASVLHAIFNYLIISMGDVLIYPTIFLIIISLLIFWDFERIKSNR
ncbi:MAG: PrsW family glutamic-type intramembrane protease [Candidatus Wolfebacteria bacterium]|nr:PrsW family glutamic-type intramembrane protease [Candidatus Wolfebacteria bacterium]